VCRGGVRRAPRDVRRRDPGGFRHRRDRERRQGVRPVGAEHLARHPGVAARYEVG